MDNYADFKQAHIVWYAITKFTGLIEKKLAILSAYRNIIQEISQNTLEEDFLNTTMDSVYASVVIDFAKLTDDDQIGDSENCSLRQLRKACMSNHRFPLKEKDHDIVNLRNIGISHSQTINKIKTVRNKREAHSDLIEIFNWDCDYPTFDELLSLYQDIADALCTLIVRIIGISMTFSDFEELVEKYQKILRNIIKNGW